MKLEDKVKVLRNEYKEHLIIIKSGSFYHTYDSDALIINKLFNYKVINNRASFPVGSLDKVKLKLEQESISFLVKDDVLKEISFNDNKYNNIKKEVIKNKLEEEKYNNLLNKVSFLIKESDEYYEEIRRFIDKF